VIVAVAPVGVVKVFVDQVVGVIRMWHRGMPTAWTVPVRRVVARAVVVRGAALRPRLVHLQPTFVDVILMLVVQMTIMDEVDVISVMDGKVPAPRTMPMIVLRVFAVLHGASPFHGWDLWRVLSTPWVKGKRACPGRTHPMRQLR
jgi:hypothetical protein